LDERAFERAMNGTVAMASPVNTGSDGENIGGEDIRLIALPGKVACPPRPHV
jgi:hypothetical protein